MNQVVKQLEKHVHWIAIALAGLWLVWTVWSFIIDYSRVEVDGAHLTPGAVDRHIAEHRQQELANAINSTETEDIPTPKPTLNLKVTVPAGINRVAIASDPPLQPITMGRLVQQVQQEVVARLPTVPAPTRLFVNRGFSNVQPPGAGPGVPPVAGAEPAGKDVVWVTLFGYINDQAVLEAFTAEKVPDFLASRRWVAVQLRRREVLVPNKEYGPVVDLRPLLFNAPPVEERNREEFRKWLEQPGTPGYVLEPAFYDVLAGDRWFVPDAQRPANTTDPLRPAVDPGVGGMGGMGGGMPGPTPRPLTLEPDAGGNFLVWQHDDTAQPGKTYQYSMRVVVMNPVYDSNVAANDQLRNQLQLPGQWSDWSAEVAIPTTMKWFVVGPTRAEGHSAQVRVIKYEKGKRNVSPTFNVMPGDAVGGVDPDSGVNYATGLTVVDVRNITTDKVLDVRVTFVDANGRLVVQTRLQGVREYTNLNQ